jgi:hypothetical protein
VGKSHLTPYPTNVNIFPVLRGTIDMVLKDLEFQKLADNVKPDAKKRIVLQKIQVDESVSYHIYKNSAGQILLDPQVSIPASEAWLFKNPEALASVKQGLLDAAKGRVSRVNSRKL